MGPLSTLSRQPADKMVATFPLVSSALGNGSDSEEEDSDEVVLHSVCHTSGGKLLSQVLLFPFPSPYLCCWIMVLMSCSFMQTL